MKNILRASLVVLTLAGMYAGFATPAPALSNPKNAVVVADGGTTMPTCPTSPTSSPSNPKGSNN